MIGDPKPSKKPKALAIDDETFAGLKEGTCRSCGASIKWWQTPAGRWMPVNPDRSSHFADCPQGKQWSKKNKGVR